MQISLVRIVSNLLGTLPRNLVYNPKKGKRFPHNV